ncbi:glycosyltransferase (family 2) [Skeletonema marinoi]|uniref:Glycosyltransferase (Family 2) n=1 Tax=Skeletonema marinoi TaxID=267567 RepID=A0AAD8Y124_9STRA|nr:glycosyltransferase (family 2) [Skeletonema marinoi]
MSRRPLMLNARHIRSIRYLLLIGLLITIFAPFILIAWHEIFGTQQHQPHSPQHLLTSTSLQKLTSKLKQTTTNNNGDWPPVLTVYSEPDLFYNEWYENPPTTKKQKLPLPRRNVHKKDLTRQRFPKLTYQNNRQSNNNIICNKIPTLLPIDQFGTTILDPYLPWIHDLFLSDDGTTVNIIAQNRRRCHKGKAHKSDMEYWEGQVALFQPVAVTRVHTSDDGAANEGGGSDNVQYRLSTHEEADRDGLETRFICRFKTIDTEKQTVQYAGETLSTYNYNYEFINWRKSKPTMVETGKDFGLFWLSPLAFNCPVPTHLQQQQDSSNGGGQPRLLLDIIPIRTPVRRNDVDGYFFHKGHGGPMTFNATKMWGKNHVLPRVEDSGRWENLPVCNKPPVEGNDSVAIVDTTTKKKLHRLVACTWTSAIHQRRGNERRISDGKARLREWIAFNLEVGFDHIYIFDNTGANVTIFQLKNEVDPDFGSDANQVKEQDHEFDDLSSVTDLFPASKVTRIEWPATICNNNRPAHEDPGERSSQYAAEAACRARYGPSTDWIASIDPDEYFVPMGNYTSWKQILDKVDKEERRSVLKFRSTRARPLLHTLVPTYDEGAKECTHEMAKNNKQCLTKNESMTYLETYNCEYIKSPKPDRFARAMKQLYRPDFVLSHFVHYSTVTADMAREKQHTQGQFIRDRTTNPQVERFVDEVNEGVLIHAKTTVPAETFARDKMCKLNGPSNCLVGIPCPDDVPFNDALHTKNVFKDENGKFCNCWMNRKVENYWLPKLKDALSKVNDG